ncbi:MAG: 3' terminal RNA ribose 2'-O-methyltransferase Hen1 [Anaerolineae bacterium]|nr:3' terminal RNA ribose 2'-O-methyltransferase Hen1 [Anaerolineae bacterium]
MLLKISTTHHPATDLSYLLHKHPARFQTFNLNFGDVHVFYTDVDDDLCTAVMFLDINPVGLTRRGSENNFALRQYVNDRPYTSTSFMSVAISKVYGSALKGKSTDRAHLVDVPLPLTVELVAIPCHDGTEMLYQLFEPLGYDVTVEQYQLDPAFPSWGDSHYFTLKLAITAPLKDVLSHLYVLIPVLDDEKHYYVGTDEIEKLLRYGESWLASHPQYNVITKRYLRHQSSLTQEALSRILADEIVTEETSSPEITLEAPLNLHQQRLNEVVSRLQSLGARRILDLGCGEGLLLEKLLAYPQFTEIIGMDVSFRSLERAQQRLKRIPDDVRARLQLIHGSLVYDDTRLIGYDVAVLIEVIEHLDEYRLSALERVIFAVAKPNAVIITTPNSDYNVNFASLPAGQFRHPDHRFEWSRIQFETWAHNLAEKYGYRVQFAPIGDNHPTTGAPTQLAQFEKGTP